LREGSLTDDGVFRGLSLKTLYFQCEIPLIEFGMAHALVPGVQASETADAVHEELRQ